MGDIVNEAGVEGGGQGSGEVKVCMKETTDGSQREENRKYVCV